MAEPKIKSFSRVIPMMYAYSTPGVTYHEGWLKIGYTEKQTVEERIDEQTHTAGVRWALAWKNNAMYADGSGEYFKDHDFHRYLTKEKRVKREKNTEWFEIDSKTSRGHLDEFARREVPVSDEELEYKLRKEQADAVAMTKAYFESIEGKDYGTEKAKFLWNAKPRFGKTLTTYDLVRQMGLKKVLIVTNRPSIANSWADDFYKFIGWRGELCFVSENDAVKDSPGVITRNEYINGPADEGRGMVAFESLAGLKGSTYFGGKFPKLEWMAKEYRDGSGKPQHGIGFDLLVIDESHEGVDTMLTERAFQNISRKYTLYLSGTPFKALANEQFSKKQIFNWSYADEQEAKEKWTGEEYNPYEIMPRLTLFTYQLSPMICDEIQKGIVLPDEDEAVDYAFDLNEFFATTEGGKFIYEEEIKKFLKALATKEKYPFSTPELRKELSHTIWILDRVQSAKALATLLKKEEAFKGYQIVSVAGDGKLDDKEDDNKEDGDRIVGKAFNRVRAAIEKYDKTITLSVGQLTVGVTIPEWSGVLMLCNMKSPASYIQATFRAQNPYAFTDEEGRLMRKGTAYVFDFDPARTLTIYDEFAQSLSAGTAADRGTNKDRKENNKRLLNYFPVFGEDSNGEMVELDSDKVLSIPRKLKSQEVVRRGFMSNFLFQNISNVFGAPSVVQEILEKLTPAHEEPKHHDKNTLSDIPKVKVDDKGNVEVPNEVVIGKAKDLFGPKVYENMKENLAPQILAIEESSNKFGQDSPQMKQQIDTLVDAVKKTITEQVIAPVINAYELKKGDQNKVKTQVEQEIERTFEKLQGDYEQQVNIAKAELDKKCDEATTEKDITVAQEAFKANIKNALEAFTVATQETVNKIIEEKPTQLVEQVAKREAEKKKKGVEDTIRDHLRGFSRTIPSFIMAYGDGNLTLQNFDEKTEPEVFKEVTGITVDNFRFLRDGGDYTNPDTGGTEHFNGNLFDEVVFDDSVEEFWNKKQALANYFDETQKEDIFDYIPPQKTNQIFTPRWVVKKMVDNLEVYNPGCFDDPTKTFADLYMKSGLYITEIVKRLFASEKMKELYPDDTERVQHILREQVYGMAPTRIIYLIATNYILGFDDRLKSETKNFVQADASKAAQNGTMKELVEKHFK